MITLGNVDSFKISVHLWSMPKVLFTLPVLVGPLDWTLCIMESTVYSCRQLGIRRVVTWLTHVPYE